MYRIVVFAPDGVKRFPVTRRDLVLGSGETCDVVLPYTGVAQQHARLELEGDGVVIEDLGARKGVFVNGDKVRRARLEELEEVRLGALTLLLEEVQPEEPEEVAEPPAKDEPEVRRISAERMVAHLARLSQWVLEDVESRVTLESLLQGILQDFGGGVVLLLHGELAKAGIKLLVASDDQWLTGGEELADQILERSNDEDTSDPTTDNVFIGHLEGRPTWICHHSYRAVERSYTLVFAIPDYQPDDWSPVDALRALGELIILGLVHHVGWFEPILPGRREQPDLILDPGLVAGESLAMQRVLERLRGAIDPPIHVLLRGEAGTGKEALARTLHISSSRRDGPFIIATAAGANATQIEADLFGAEIRGKEGPVRREGKLLLADGGTLFLDDVESLPIELQARLVRFLRSGAIEPAGSVDATTVDVRLVASSRGPLEPFVARDQFRVDLAYRLSQTAIDVPALRERRADLPLLIQTCINRFCHETGKRMQGITVKAMSALLAYGYPGNLPDLENVVRQLVYMCPAGQPADVNLLPEKVRRSSVAMPATADISDLNLERLVAQTEESAIREALRRTGDNKSQAARELGLSRNGLSAKMKRFGLED